VTDQLALGEVPPVVDSVPKLDALADCDAAELAVTEGVRAAESCASRRAGARG
jgi:hypothetical protein